jgi:hypothetical protein
MAGLHWEEYFGPSSCEEDTRLAQPIRWETKAHVTKQAYSLVLTWASTDMVSGERASTLPLLFETTGDGVEQRRSRDIRGTKNNHKRLQNQDENRARRSISPLHELRVPKSSVSSFPMV